MKTNRISLIVTILLLTSCHKEVDQKHPVLSVDIAKRDRVSVFDMFERVEFSYDSKALTAVVYGDSADLNPQLKLLYLKEKW